MADQQFRPEMQHIPMCARRACGHTPPQHAEIPTGCAGEDGACRCKAFVFPARPAPVSA